MDVVGGAILSAFLQPLFEKLASADLLNFARKKHIDTVIKELESRLLEIQAVLSDAEEKQFTNRAVKIWLGKLQDLAYDVDDVLDEFATDALESKLTAGSQGSISKIRKLIPNYLSNPSKGSKLEKITARLKEIVAEKNRLDLSTHADWRSNRGNERLPTASLVKERNVYGREEDREAIIKLLMSGESSDSRFSVISIIGMGGIGKTTLAQLIYNDDRMNFDCKAWVCVSDDFDILRITKTLILHWGNSEANDLNLLQVSLKEKLSGKRFLIVLDDVWSKSYEKWTALCSPFAAGAVGSKIIVTTRDKEVSSITNPICAHELNVLSHNDCLSLFTQHSIDAENFDAYPNLREIGEKLVQRCKGLPLAAKALGGLLRGKQNPKEWEGILNSKIWDLPEDKSDILPVLRLSYHHLPSHLKQCFAYCAIFPKDYEFDKNKLVLQWMAEGFLQQSPGTLHKEDLGHEYFSELMSRSFFQQSVGNTSRYVMHDLISDLACSVSKEICFILEEKSEGEKSYLKVRHASLTSCRYDTWQRFEVFNEMQNLRTLLPISLRSHYLSGKVLLYLVPKLKRLRVLSLAGYKIVELLLL